jgi:hypothetical protein
MGHSQPPGSGSTACDEPVAGFGENEAVAAEIRGLISDEFLC